MDDTDDKMDEMKKQLQEILGDDASIYGFKGTSLSDAISKVNKFMNTPIVKIECTRTDTYIDVNNCTSEEAKYAVIQAITYMLELFPKEWRNDILYEAIQETEEKHDEGRLFEDEKEQNE